MCKRTFFLIVAVWIGAVYAQAQTVTGAIVGRVVDSSGAVVPGVQLTITNQATDATRAAVSSDDGVFRVPQLVPGTYTISAELPGFAKAVLKEVVVAIASETPVEVKMSLGGITQEAQVTAEAVNVNTESAAVITLMTENLIEQVPLNARDIQQLAVIQPGVQAYTNNWGNQIVIAGSRPQQNRYLQEGTDTTWTSKTAPVSAAGVVLGVEAVKEFQILTSNYTAQYGERPGGTLNALFKSGTNTLHGSGYEYYRNSVFDARSFFDRGSAPPPFKRHQFGTSLGGPIEKDKTFFFFNYEGYRHALGQTQIAFVPDDQARLGYLPCGSIAAPKPAACSAAGATDSTLAQVPGFIPGGFIQGVMNLLEPPCSGSSIGGGVCPSSNVTSQNVRENYYVGKTDFILGSKDTLSVSYNYDASLSQTPQVNPNFLLTQKVRKQIVSARDTHIFSTNLVSTWGIGFNRTFFLWDLNVTTPIPGGLINGGNPYTLPNNGVFSPMGLPILPVVSVSGLTPIAAFSSGTTLTPRWVGYAAGTLGYDADYLHGRHSWKFGAQYKKWHDNVYNSASQIQGTIAYPSLSKFLSNEPNTFGQLVPGRSDYGRGWRQWLLGLYAEDNYRIKQNVAVTLGLRWEVVPGPREMHGRITNLLNPESDSRPTLGTYFHASKRNFEPRIGINWDPFNDGKMSVRTGFGIFHDEIEGYYFFIGGGQQPPYSTRIVLRNTTTPRASWPTPDIAALQTLPGGLGVFPQTMPLYPTTPTKYSYNLEIQRQLPAKLTMSVGYVGSTSRHLGRPYNATDFYPMIQAPGEGACPLDGPSCLFWPGAGLPSLTPTSLTVNPGPQPASLQYFSSVSGYLFDSNAFYNSLEVRVRRNVGNGFNTFFGYTHSNCITDSSGETPGQALNVTTLPAYTRAFNSSRGRCGFTASDVANVNLAYDIPFAKAAQSRLIKGLVSGWHVSSLTAVSNGLPLNVLAGVAITRQSPTLATGTDRPNWAPGCNAKNAVNPRNPNYIKVSCFQLQTPGYLGNVGANILTGPAFWSTDASLRKDFGLKGERLNLRVQIDMFNVFNRTNLGTTTNSVGAFNSSGAPNSAFGQITNIIGTPRQLQFGAKFSF